MGFNAEAAIGYGLHLTKDILEKLEPYLEEGYQPWDLAEYLPDELEVEISGCDDYEEMFIFAKETCTDADWESPKVIDLEKFENRMTQVWIFDFYIQKWLTNLGFESYRNEDLRADFEYRWYLIARYM